MKALKVSWTRRHLKKFSKISKEKGSMLKKMQPGRKIGICL
jgi:transposase-like protein